MSVSERVGSLLRYALLQYVSIVLCIIILEDKLRGFKPKIFSCILLFFMNIKVKVQKRVLFCLPPQNKLRFCFVLLQNLSIF